MKIWKLIGAERLKLDVNELRVKELKFKPVLPSIALFLIVALLRVKSLSKLLKIIDLYQRFLCQYKTILKVK